MIPTIGRIVHFKLGDANVHEINRRRDDARASAISGDKTGAQVHVGNAPSEGDVYPMLITRVWDSEPTEDSVVQGQVFLDGNDVLWVTSAQQGDGEYQWSEPVRR